MLEIRCMDQGMRFNNNLQTRYTKDALFWFLDHLNLTEIIEERSDMQVWSLFFNSFKSVVLSWV